MRFAFVRVPLLSLWLLLLCVINGTLVQAQPLPERRTLSGRVLGVDGKPIVGATITMSRENQEGGFAFWGALTVTDAQGNFSFPDAEEDTYLISVEAEGFAPDQNRRYVLDTNSRSWQVTLQRLANVTLRFLKTDGTPLVSSPVVMRLELPQVLNQLLRRQTDEKGQIELQKIRPGAYKIQTVASGAGYALVKDVPIQFSPQPQTIDVKLQSGGTVHITAREAADANDPGKPMGGAGLTLGQSLQINGVDRVARRTAGIEEMNWQSLYASTGDPEGPVTRDGDGALDVSDLPPGRYMVRLLAPNYAPTPFQDVEVKAGATSNLEFRFAPRPDSASLEVLLEDKAKNPVVSTDWNLQLRLLSKAVSTADAAAPPLPGGEELLVELTMNPIGGVTFRRARTDAQGRFTLYPLPPGKWRILLSPRREPGQENRGLTFQKDVDIPATGTSTTITIAPPKP